MLSFFFFFFVKKYNYWGKKNCFELGFEILLYIFLGFSSICFQHESKYLLQSKHSNKNLLKGRETSSCGFLYTSYGGTHRTTFVS